MFLVVLANLVTDEVGKIVIIAQASFGLKDSIMLLRQKTGKDIDLIEIEHLTGGPADTIDLARALLEPDLPIITANSDQYVVSSLNPMYEQLSNPETAGSILTMNDNDPKWSYVNKDACGRVILVREKEVISNLATVGIYGFRSARLMWQGFDAMREAKGSVNGEYYVAPAYNYLINKGLNVVTYDLGPIKSAVHGMGIPKDYESFIQSPASLVAAARAQDMFGSR
jgi:dTDP-glucose pyrophosphorylase